jgi:predicted transcriptional regulator/DNA-binding XRE family transcriptional regulator
MPKSFAGVRIKRLREEQQLTQAALAHVLGLSTTYVNQLERNQRPLTLPVLLKIKEVFGTQIALDEDRGAGLIDDLRNAFADLPVNEGVALAELREVAETMPALGRAILDLHRQYRLTLHRSNALAAGIGTGREAAALGASPLPHEEVRDFFYDRRNHVAELDEAAERLARQEGFDPGTIERRLEALLLGRHGVRVIRTRAHDEGPIDLRHFDPISRTLRLPASRSSGQNAFQMATQLGFLTHGPLLDRLTGEGRFTHEDSRGLARIGLANYFAGALLLPYTSFLEEAERLSYDIELLVSHFRVGYETICHRLSTLQRPGARGVPFFFVRVDRAGNISKRQSATDLHFLQVGGTCPLWNVYEAFASPGRILTQIARMPDDRSYLWIARTVVHETGGWGMPSKTFAVGLGCDVQHAGRLIYSRGLNLSDASAATPIGGGCRVCDRPACPQRAFPQAGRKLSVDEHRSRFEAYHAGWPTEA